MMVVLVSLGTMEALIVATGARGGERTTEEERGYPLQMLLCRPLKGGYFPEHSYRNATLKHENQRKPNMRWKIKDPLVVMVARFLLTYYQQFIFQRG